MAQSPPGRWISCGRAPPVCSWKSTKKLGSSAKLPSAWDNVATLISSDSQPEGLSAPSQGNAQTTPEDGLVVGWGALPYFSEFSPSGKLIFNAELPAGVNSYRAYQFQWPPSHGFGGFFGR